MRKGPCYVRKGHRDVLDVSKEGSELDVSKRELTVCVKALFMFRKGQADVFEVTAMTSSLMNRGESSSAHARQSRIGP